LHPTPRQGLRRANKILARQYRSTGHSARCQRLADSCAGVGVVPAREVGDLAPHPKRARERWEKANFSCCKKCNYCCGWRTRFR